MVRLPLSLLVVLCLIALPVHADAVKSVRETKAGKKKTANITIVVTKNDKVLTGNIVKTTPLQITLKTTGGKTFVIVRKNIEVIRAVQPKAAARRVFLVSTRGPGGAGIKLVRIAVAAKPANVKKVKVKVRKAAQQAQIIRLRGISSSRTAGVRKDVDAKDNVERLLLLSPQGPVLVEMEILLDGEPFRIAREKLVDEMMKQADKNKDGQPKWEEAIVNPRFAYGRLAYASRNAAYRKSLIKRYDVNKDGLVDRYEARLVLAQSGYGTAFQLTRSPTYRAQPDVKTLLDTNKDGMLSKAELKAAAERLKSRDANDNDLLEAGELGGTRAGSRYRVQFKRGVRLPTRAREVYLLGPTANLVALYSALKSKYGDKSGRIPAAAFRIDAAMFKLLDLNKDGFLGSGETIGFHLLKPQVKLKLFIGKGKSGPGVLITSIRGPFAGTSAVGKTARERVTLAMPGWKVVFHVPAMTRRRYDYTRTAKSYLTRYDKNKNGYIEKKEMGTNKYQLQQFDRWDGNSDGKVYADEIKASFDRALAPQMSQIRVAALSQGPSLFAALDTSGDKRLSLREMRTAGTRLLSLDKNKDGKISAAEMPGEVVLTFSQGGTYYGFTRVIRNGVRTTRRTTPSRGPKWFVHMDKNGDGDITLREFLGTKEKFQELDTNKDGFIELKEAEAVGKRISKRSK
ncbi:MAG: hypothetical protein IID45_00920 [Planctomycetes bacterium]|nr:hypothetical protein [Planctomycetota bacterium]